MIGVGSGGGYGGFVRRLSRDPGYGLRKRRKEYGSKDTRPAGPKLVRGRGLRRRRAPALGAAWVVAILVLLAAVGVIVIRLLRVMAW
jgi:hypothetical protein